MRYALVGLFLVLSACASAPKPAPVAASVLTVKAPPTCIPQVVMALPDGWFRYRPILFSDGTCMTSVLMREGSGTIFLRVLSTKNTSFERTIVDGTAAIEKNGYVITRLLPKEWAGTYRIDAYNDTSSSSTIYLRTGIPGVAYAVSGQWRPWDAEAGEQALEQIVQNLPVSP